MKQKCPFCVDGLFPYHKEIGVDVEHSIFLEDENIYVTPDISPVGEGHYLIITKEHCTNFVSSSVDVHLSLKNAIDIIVKNIYRSESYVVFEHGATLLKSAGNSINHAHVHIVKGEYQLIDNVKKEGFRPEQIHWCDFDTYADMSLDLPYIWISESGSKSIFINPDNLPSQYLRRKILEEKPLEYDFDWGKNFSDHNSINQFHHNLYMALERIGN